MADTDLRSVAEALTRAARAHRRAAGQIDGILQELERTEVEMRSWAAVIRGLSATGGGADNAIRVAGRARQELARAREALRGAAAQGVAEIRFERRVDGGKAAVVDGQRLALTLELMSLLSVLAMQAQIGPEYVAHAELTRLIGEQSGHPLTAAARRQLVYRLREAFATARLNRDFIDSDPRQGVRLLLRRVSAQPTNEWLDRGPGGSRG